MPTSVRSCRRPRRRAEASTERAGAGITRRPDGVRRLSRSITDHSPGRGPGHDRRQRWSDRDVEPCRERPTAWSASITSTSSLTGQAAASASVVVVVASPTTATMLTIRRSPCRRCRRGLVGARLYEHHSDVVAGNDRRRQRAGTSTENDSMPVAVAGAVGRPTTRPLTMVGGAASGRRQRPGRRAGPANARGARSAGHRRGLGWRRQPHHC